MRPVVSRNLVVQKWGTPSRAWGSVNEPRERRENDIVFNEKWVYERPRGERGVRRRIIYWRRYDFVASLVERENGEFVREDLGAAVAGELPDRRYRHQSDASSGARAKRPSQ